MAVINRHFKARGFSSKTRKLLSLSWRPGTKKDYVAKLRKFCGWCGETEIDPLLISLTDAADFLTDLFHSGLQYKAIEDYKSMLSAIATPVDNKPICQHPDIIRLLKAVF